jgi:Pathogenicity locus
LNESIKKDNVSVLGETKAKKKGVPMTNPRTLKDLISVGAATLRDFELLKVRSVAQLAKQDPKKMYDKLQLLTGTRQDPCVLDTFRAAVAQARNPRLPAQQCQWWYWSRKRKSVA